MFSRGLRTLDLRICNLYPFLTCGAWGQDFFSSYFEIGTIIRFCPKDPKDELLYTNFVYISKNILDTEKVYCWKPDWNQYILPVCNRYVPWNNCFFLKVK